MLDKEKVGMTIERKFDIPFVASMALKEKQIQQNYRPIIAIHKWFARRPGTLFRSLILSEFVDKPLREIFFSSNSIEGVTIADPFMGGGTPLIEANRVGCNVIGYDINPMAYWIVKQELKSIDVLSYRKRANELIVGLRAEVGNLYTTNCDFCGEPEVPVKYFLWVKTLSCNTCGKEFDLFPGYLIAENRRHPKNVFICPDCGELNESESRERPGKCHSCNAELALSGPARRGRCACSHCQAINIIPADSSGPPKHRMVAIEYHCHKCRSARRGRFFKKPGPADLEKYQNAVSTLSKIRARFIPNDEIPAGDETQRLHRWGYCKYREMFNQRQLLGLEISCRLIAREQEDSLRNALATNLSDLLRYQNMLCRYDTKALKSLDIFSVHGFPVGLVQCESNLLGIRSKEGLLVGSGGWENIVEKYSRAKEYCIHPYETVNGNGSKKKVFISGEWIGERTDQEGVRDIELICNSSTDTQIPAASLNAVFTDPPYFGNVQYAELMDFCFVWLRKLVSSAELAFKEKSTRNPNELTGNVSMDRGIEHFTEGLSSVYQNMAKALKPGSPLVFTYHHNKLEAYLPIIVAILDAGLVCSASLPCPGEMGASIHINGTASSIIDTILVCRSTGSFPRSWLAGTPKEIARLVKDDISLLRQAGIEPTKGDIRCILFGHIARLAIWNLHKDWDKTIQTSAKLETIKKKINEFATPESVEKHLEDEYRKSPSYQSWEARERAIYGRGKAVSF